MFDFVAGNIYQRKLDKPQEEKDVTANKDLQIEWHVVAWVFTKFSQKIRSLKDDKQTFK